MAQSKPYNFYSLNNVPALVSLNNDDYDEEPETDFSEEYPKARASSTARIQRLFWWVTGEKVISLKVRAWVMVNLTDFLLALAEIAKAGS